MPGVRELVFHKFYDNLISKWEKRYLKNLCLLTNSLSLRPLTFSLLKRICRWSDTAATNFPCVFPPARPVVSCTHVKYKRLLRRLLTHIIYVAECKLGKIKLETMLASCLSLEFTGSSHGYFAWVSGILMPSCWGHLISLVLYYVKAFACIYFSSLPTVPFGKYI